MVLVKDEFTHLVSPLLRSKSNQHNQVQLAQLLIHTERQGSQIRCPRLHLNLRPAAGGSVFSFLLRRVDLGREKRLYKQLLFSCSTNHWCWRSHHTSRLEVQRFHQRTWYCSSQTCRAGNLVICKYKMPALAIYVHSIRLFEDPEISKTMNIKEKQMFFPWLWSKTGVWVICLWTEPLQISRETCNLKKLEDCNGTNFEE